MRRVLLLATLLLAVQVHAKKASDSKIGKAASELATNYLAKDIESGKGIAFFALGQKLAPKSDHILLLKALIERQAKPKPIQTKTKEGKFLDYLVKEALGISKDKKPEEYKANRALAYLRLAEIFRPTDHEVLLGLARLEVNGYAGSYSDALAAEWGAKAAAPKNGDEEVAAEDGEGAEEGDAELNLDKIKYKVNRKRSKSSAGNQKVDSIELKVTLTNAQRKAIEAGQIQLRSMVIGERILNKGTYFIAADSTTDVPALKSNREVELDGARADLVEVTRGARMRRRIVYSGTKTGDKYEGWIVALVDGDDKILKVEASSSMLEKIAETVFKMAEGGGFDRKGNRR